MRWLITDLDYTLLYPFKHKNDHFDGDERIVFQRQNAPHRGMMFPEALRQFVLASSDKRVAISARPLSEITKLDMGFMWDYIICAHGSEIYQTGTQIADLTTDQTRTLIKEMYNTLKDRVDNATEHCQLPERINLVRTHGSDHAAFIEIKLHSANDTYGFIRSFDVNYLSADPAIELQQNGRTLTLKPRAIDKADALSYLIDNHINVVDKSPFLMGAGDSDSDLAFMKRCHIAISPSHSQIIQQTR